MKGETMSKKRFVEFYLAAMMKAATDGRVSKLTYQYVEGGKRIPAMECVTVVLEDRSGVPVPVNGYNLLEIALEVVKAVQGL